MAEKTPEKTSDTDSVVMVDHTDANSTTSVDSEDIPSDPVALQIISIGSEEDQYAFTFHEKKLNAIMSKIPPGWKVAVVSVCLLYTSPSPRDLSTSRMPSSA